MKMIGIDKNRAWNGVDFEVEWENGKAEIRVRVFLREQEDGRVKEPDRERSGVKARTSGQWGMVEVWIRTREGQEAAYLRMQVKNTSGDSERFMAAGRTLLIDPHLWQGVSDPYVYEAEILLCVPGQEGETVLVPCPVFCEAWRNEDEYWLNGKPYALQAVSYLPGQQADKTLEKDLELLRELGVNCLYPEVFPEEKEFYRRCLEAGLVLQKGQRPEGMPAFGRAGGPESLLREDRIHRTDAFYAFQAASLTSVQANSVGERTGCRPGRNQRKMLHLCQPVKVSGTGSGKQWEAVQEAPAEILPGTEPEASSEALPRAVEKYRVTVYSNQKKVALYVNGYLREFKESPPCFVFEEVEAGPGETVFSARSEECFMSCTVFSGE